MTDAGAGGNTYASDDIAGVHYPILKVAFGALDTATLVTGSAGFPVNVVAALPTGANTIGTVNIGTFPDNEPFNIAQMNGVTVTMGNGVSGTGVQRVTIASDSTGQVALAAGTANIGDVDVLTIAAGTNLIGDVGLGVRTSGGLSFFKTIDLDETEEAVKATAGQLYALHVMNLTVALLYLKIYNATVATVVVGTTVPDITIPIAGNNDTDGAGFVWSIPQGIAFGTAITVAATTGVADNDAGAPAVNAMVLTALYA